MNHSPAGHSCGPGDASPSPQITGWCQGADHGIGDMPVDQLLVRHDQWTVFNLLRRVESSAIVVPSEFPNGLDWPSDKQGRFLESILMRLPLPRILAVENRQGQIVLVDGWRRLATLWTFLRTSTPLNLPHRPDLHGKTLHELPVRLQNRLEDLPVELAIIDWQTPAHVTLELLERVNSGPFQSRQEMRAVLHQGAATRFLQEQAASPLFLSVTAGDLSPRTMLDCEFINRFCAFDLLPIQAYDGNLDDFLAKSLERMNALNPPELAEVERRLHQALRNNQLLFGEHAFRQSATPDSPRGPLNAALWDVMATSLAKFSDDEIQSKATRLREAYFGLQNRPEFLASISSNPNSRAQVQIRFSLVAIAFHESLDRMAS